MPTDTHPTDRFDDLGEPQSRVGAHRAENPKLSLKRVVGWSAVATVALVLAGILAVLLATGTLSFGGGQAEAPLRTAEPVVDTEYSVLVLNATEQSGLAGEVSAEIVDAGWSEDSVSAGEAGSSDFATTTVYYANPEAEGAARGLAQELGVTTVVLNDSYQPLDDPATTDVDEGGALQLVVVIGLDRAAQN